MIFNKEKGFTIIELMFSMAFFSILLLSVIMTVMQMNSIYRKGITTKSVAQVGQELSDSFKRDFASSQLSSSSNPSSFFFKGNDGGYGKMCLGSVAYIWNNIGERSITSGSQTIVGGRVVTLSRVSGDMYNTVCPDGDDWSKNFNISNTNNPNYTNMLNNENGVSLGVKDFNIEKVSISGSSKVLYKVNFTVGTNDQKAFDTSGTRCKPPTSEGNDWNYCAINKFEIIVATNGGV